MKIKSAITTLRLKYPFKISRGPARYETETMIIKLKHEGFTGLGEVKPSEYYFSETFAVTAELLKKAEKVIGNNPFQVEDILNELREIYPNSPASLAGIDIALHDLICKMLNIPIYKYLGLNKDKTPITSYTIAIDTIPIMVKKLKEAQNYPIIKVKLGTTEDIKIMKALRDNTDAIIRVDANTDWEVDEAIKKINELEKFNVELVEQPIKPGNYKGLRKIKNSVNIPIMADEDVINSKDVPKLAGCVDSINIKLMKCGGIREAVKMIHTAKTFGLKVMLGCMIESSVANSAAAHISPLVDYADLDTHLLITNDPFEGLGNINGKQILSDSPGLGLTEK
jgi:L-alanine-DL-glutamate epimerase-like enolase superfamily enzyme